MLDSIQQVEGLTQAQDMILAMVAPADRRRAPATLWATLARPD